VNLHLQLMVMCDLMLTCRFHASSVYPFREHGKLVLLLSWILPSEEQLIDLKVECVLLSMLVCTV